MKNSKMQNPYLIQPVELGLVLPNITLLYLKFTKKFKNRADKNL